MAAARETNDALVKPGEAAVVHRFVAGSAIEAGMPVAMASDGAVGPADASDVTLNNVLGIALQDVAAGVTLDVVTGGPVLCMGGATIGANIYTSDTAGGLGETAGTKTTIVGVAVSATVLFVRPIMVSLS